MLAVTANHIISNFKCSSGPSKNVEIIYAKARVSEPECSKVHVAYGHFLLKDLGKVSNLFFLKKEENKGSTPL